MPDVLLDTEAAWQAYAWNVAGQAVNHDPKTDDQTDEWATAQLVNNVLTAINRINSWSNDSVMLGTVGMTGVHSSGVLTLTADGGDLVLAPGPGGSDNVVIDGLTWPGADGTSGQVLTTNGSGVLSWADGGGDGSAWAAILAVGAVSGGTSPVLSDGDELRSPDGASTNDPGIALVIRPGAGDGEGAGGDLDLHGGTAGDAGSGGNVNLRPAAMDGGIVEGRVAVIPAWAGDTSPFLALEGNGTNSATARFFAGDRDPNSNVTGDPGDLYIRAGDATAKVYQHRGGSSSNDDWVDVAAQLEADSVTELKALGTDDGIVAGVTRAKITSTGNEWTCVTADATTSTWRPGNGVYNVCDYGAVGGGSATTNQAAFEAALADGRNVCAPYHASGYLLNDGITVQDAELWTVGYTRLLFTLPDDNTDGITIEWTGLYNDGLASVKGFMITGAGASDTGVPATDNASAAGRDLVVLKGGERSRIIDCQLRHSKRDGWRLEGAANSQWGENQQIINTRAYWCRRYCGHIVIPSGFDSHFINELYLRGLECRVGGAAEVCITLAGGGSSKIEGVTAIGCNFDVGNRSVLTSPETRITTGSVYIDAAGGSASLARLSWINCTFEDTTGYATNGVEDPIGFSGTGLVSSMTFRDCATPTGFNPANSNRYCRAGHPTYDSGYVTHYLEQTASRFYATGDFITGQLKLGTPGTPTASSLLHLAASGTSCEMRMETTQGGGLTLRANDTGANPSWRLNVNSGEEFFYAVGGGEKWRVGANNVTQTTNLILDSASPTNTNGDGTGSPVVRMQATADGTNILSFRKGTSNADGDYQLHHTTDEYLNVDIFSSGWFTATRWNPSGGTGLGDIEHYASMHFDSASPSLVLGDASGSPLLQLDKDDSGTATLELTNEGGGTGSWRIQSTSAEALNIDHHAGGGGYVNVISSDASSVDIFADLTVSGDIGDVANVVGRVFTDGAVLGVQTSTTATTDDTAIVRVDNSAGEATITLDEGRPVGTVHLFAVLSNSFDANFSRDGSTETINGDTVINRDGPTSDAQGLYIAVKDTSTTWKLYGPVAETADSST